MNDTSKADYLCELFLQTVNQYLTLEKQIHTYDVTPKIYLAEIHTIIAIYEHKNINITSLAKLQKISRSATSQVVSKLVKKGFVEKNVSSETENEVVLSLTEKGVQVVDMHKKQHAILQGKLIDIFKKYPPETMDIISSLAIDIQDMWKEVLENALFL